MLDAFRLEALARPMPTVGTVVLAMGVAVVEGLAAGLPPSRSPARARSSLWPVAVAVAVATAERDRRARARRSLLPHNPVLREIVPVPAVVLGEVAVVGAWETSQPP